MYFNVMILLDTDLHNAQLGPGMYCVRYLHDHTPPIVTAQIVFTIGAWQMQTKEIAVDTVHVTTALPHVHPRPTTTFAAALLPACAVLLFLG